MEGRNPEERLPPIDDGCDPKTSKASPSEPWIQHKHDPLPGNTAGRQSHKKAAIER